MPDFLDRFGEQLRVAQESAAPITSRTPPGPKGPSRNARRGLLLGLGLLAIAAPAAAIVQPWNPTLGRPGIDPPVARDNAPVSADATGALAVLRRPQSAEDRATAAPLLRTVANQVDGAQVDAIRALATDWALVPVKDVATGNGAVEHDQLCITNGDSIACGPAATVRLNGVGLSQATPNRTILSGLVPDGVARVRFTPSRGAPVEVAASSNFYSLTIAEVGSAGMVKAPEGSNGPAMIPGPPLPIGGRIEWLDSKAQVVGPQKKQLGRQ
jgi:hypothetical protein